MPSPVTTPRLKVSDLRQDRPTAFSLAPDAPQMAAIAEQLGLDKLRKLTFTGRVTTRGKAGWQLDARLGATVVQPCVVTLAPVTARLDETITRLFLARMPAAADSEPVEEVEMASDDDMLEPLRPEIDLEALMIEALALALPLYPRAADAALETAAFAAPGVTPMRDDDTRPFAGLAALRDQLDDQQGDKD